MKSKEIARLAGKRKCDQSGVQFLDDTVEKKKVWLRRNEAGKLELCRLFFFEFSSDGAHRYQGRMMLLGKRVFEVEINTYRI